MPQATVSICKFVGSISLGLLTGISYTVSTITIPSLLLLPSAVTAHHTFIRLQGLSLTNLRTLAAISTSSFLLAYTLSPSRARHPYLLWTALTVALSAGSDLWLSRDVRRMVREKTRRGGDAGSAGSPTNGEEVRKNMEQFRLAQGVRAGIAGLGFLMSVVGIWGDGF
ncbi:MAG: hypothetical protein M1816_007575 [Peltula sp. TS41687]|nr:MAG: hypothetical protein M1816_007575 [Peltula sp. TS41687]